ncbi:hypothetical protein PVAND_007579 [Polypedilum vanderplanki]|uniref:Uncharacterized protein n=1 Tax=Polypedilum vanderplanki TaxID=319348 RepID=A0A9J6C7S4_POLVA|nr:hypothetical protein PVAND_007579 [Polypedilum vanderplanki]
MNGQSEAGILNILKDLIQWNYAGIPLIHQETQWDFDPEISKLRREQYYELHGYRGAKYLERIGQGFDGRHRERALQQKIRDDGHLQGLNLLQP